MCMYVHDLGCNFADFYYQEKDITLITDHCLTHDGDVAFLPLDCFLGSSKSLHWIKPVRFILSYMRFYAEVYA